jgi:hypothetical protein
VFDELGLAIIIGGPIALGIIPLLFILAKNPEARAFITAWLKARVVIFQCDDSGQATVKTARALSEGQFIAGKNVYRQREIFVTPRINNPFVSKRFVLQGIRRSIFFNYAGKTALVNPETLAAIEVAETKDKDELPEPVRKWAESQGIELRVKKKDNPRKSEKKTFTLFALDPRTLRHYFDIHYDESQIDVLLEQSREDGFQEGKGGKGIGKMVIVGFLVIVVVLVVAMVASKMGWL